MALVTSVLLATAIVARLPWPVVGLLALGVWRPLLGAVALGVALLFRASRRRTEPVDSEATWCGAMAAELRAGASLRAAIEAASARTPELGLAGVGRLARAGVPLSRLSNDVAAALPRLEALVGPALRLAAESGGAAAGVFGRLAVRGLEEAEAERERRVSTAQARLSAWVIGTLPVVVIVGMLVTGRAATLVSVGPIGVGALVLGIGLQVSGVAAVWVLSRRAAR